MALTISPCFSSRWVSSCFTVLQKTFGLIMAFPQAHLQASSSQNTLKCVDFVAWSWANHIGQLFLKVLSVSGWFDSDCSIWNTQVASERRGMWMHTHPPRSQWYRIQSLNCSPALAGLAALREEVAPATAVKPPSPHFLVSLFLAHRNKSLLLTCGGIGNLLPCLVEPSPLFAILCNH